MGFFLRGSTARCSYTQRPSSSSHLFWVPQNLSCLRFLRLASFLTLAMTFVGPLLVSNYAQKIPPGWKAGTKSVSLPSPPLMTLPPALDTPALHYFSLLGLVIIKFCSKKKGWFYYWKESLKSTARVDPLVGLSWEAVCGSEQETLSDQPARCWGGRVLEPHWDPGSHTEFVFLLDVCLS